MFGDGLGLEDLLSEGGVEVGSQEAEYYIRVVNHVNTAIQNPQGRCVWEQ